MADRKEHRKHLYYLHELSDFKVDSDDPDVRGWPVKDVDNRVVGKVDNLLVSKEKKRVVYLDVEVDKSIIDANHDPYGNPASEVHEFINRDGENHLILPIGLARLNVDDKYVYTDKINHRTFAETKRMEKGYDVDRDYEVVVLESYNRDLDRDNRRDNDLDAERRRMQEADRDRDTTLSDRDRTITDRDHTDRDRDNLTGRDTGRTTDRRDSGRIPEDDSFYDRGEFDRTRYRDNR
ncbi:PRC-barrel domain-containing protein [Salinimicrobium xinjiangense]|uniref:PRC-barrel domain-containing protein n=1 Tax=Salinimicrobium xinjiangense TaxID=438596 RepID=UPI000414A10A|nr:PRC-barrel domain-containing protein [Salinimicrobium xinjiangense]